MFIFLLKELHCRMEHPNLLGKCYTTGRNVSLPPPTSFSIMSVSFLVNAFLYREREHTPEVSAHGRKWQEHQEFKIILRDFETVLGYTRLVSKGKEKGKRKGMNK